MKTTKKSSNSFNTLSTLHFNGKEYHYHSLKKLNQQGNKWNQFPYSLKILLENMLRHEDGFSIHQKDIEAFLNGNLSLPSDQEIQFMPARILLQDFTGIPVIADLSAMRNAIQRLGGDPNWINPLQPVDLVIDHSVQVDEFGSHAAFQANADLEFQRNKERYQFLKWGQKAFQNFRVVPPGTGIVHQINLEYLASVILTKQTKEHSWIFPDTLVGTDSHTTMINGMGVLGWGVGGIEAEAALLGQPCSLLIPQVVGFKLTGKLNPGATATDLALTVTEILRKKGVVGKFVEFFGTGLKNLSLADRATLANMAPEYGATVGLFPVDSIVLKYLELTGRGHLTALIQAYYEEQGLWYDPIKEQQEERLYSDQVELNLSQVEPSLAGPARPQDRVSLAQVPQSFEKLLYKTQKTLHSPVKSKELSDGAIVIASITSCTNTSNPTVMMTAGLLARNAVKKGLNIQPWVKTSLAPGSQVVTQYLKQAGLMDSLEALRFHLVGYGCTTCIGNSGPLDQEIENTIKEKKLLAVSVISGNRNFEGRIHRSIKANYLASPALVIAYAIAGHIQINLSIEPIGMDSKGCPVFLKDIWPSQEEIEQLVFKHVTPQQFKESYSHVFSGSAAWQSLTPPTGNLYQWDSQSTYIKEPPFIQDMTLQPKPIQAIRGIRILAHLGDSVTTDHISPAGSIAKTSPAGCYLTEHWVNPEDYNSYGSRRGNHQVMVRGTFAHSRLRNALLPEVEGGLTYHFPTQKQMSIFEASQLYQEANTPLMIIAGKEYGTGSSRDWAAKGPNLLGVRVILAESFERIHRSNLVGMGILPLQFLAGENAKILKISEEATFDILELDSLSPRKTIEIHSLSLGVEKKFQVLVRIDTPNELDYFKNSGILPYVLRQTLDRKNNAVGRS